MTTQILLAVNMNTSYFRPILFKNVKLRLCAGVEKLSACFSSRSCQPVQLTAAPGLSVVLCFIPNTRGLMEKDDISQYVDEIRGKEEIGVE